MVSAVEWNGSRFVAVGDFGIIYTSTDGIKWTEVKSVTGDNLYDIVWNGKKFVAVGYDGTIIESIDGLSWNKINIDTKSELQKLFTKVKKENLLHIT